MPIVTLQKLFLGGEKEDHGLLLVEAHTPVHKKEWELVDLKYFKPKYSYMASYKQPFFFFRAVRNQRYSFKP